MSTDVHTLSGAYALDALDYEEAVEFRRHLADCQVCRDEVRELRTAAARMGAAEATAPPAELRSRVLAAAARTPQQPPRVPSTPTPARPSGEPAPPVELASRRRPRWLVAAAAAAWVVVGGVVGVQTLAGDDDPDLAPMVVQVLEATDARTATVNTANGGTVTVGVSPERNEMAVDTRELPDPGAGRVYQVWSVDDGKAVSAAVLDDPDRGAAMGMPAEGTEVAITLEPAGGSTQPTGEVLVQVDPRAVLES